LKMVAWHLLKKDALLSINEIASSIGCNRKTTRNALDILVYFNIVLECERDGITRQYKLTEFGNNTTFLRSLQYQGENREIL